MAKITKSGDGLGGGTAWESMLPPLQPTRCFNATDRKGDDQGARLHCGCSGEHYVARRDWQRRREGRGPFLVGSMALFW